MSANENTPAPKPRRQTTAPEIRDSLSEDEAMLALAVPVESPAPGVKERLMMRVRAARAAETNATPDGWRFESANEEASWRTGAFPGVAFKTLSVDEARDVVMVMIRMEPGSRFPDHVHDDGPDEGVVISGDVITGGRLMRAGDYYFAGEGTKQVDTVSPSGCTALVSLTARAWKKWRQYMGVQ
jgi:quercetin dioxygenase-like cupin family protein